MQGYSQTIFYQNLKKKTWKADFLGLIITLERRGDYAVFSLVSVSEGSIPGPATADSPPVVSYYLKAVKERSREIITASGAKGTMGKGKGKGRDFPFPFPSSSALP